MTDPQNPRARPQAEAVGQVGGSAGVSEPADGGGGVALDNAADLLTRLRSPANWLCQDRGTGWKDGINRYDRAPFEAADEIERLKAGLVIIANTADVDADTNVLVAKRYLDGGVW